MSCQPKKLAKDLLDMAALNGVTITTEGDWLVFRGSGRERRLSIEKLSILSDDQMDRVARDQVLGAIHYANMLEYTEKESDRSGHSFTLVRFYARPGDGETWDSDTWDGKR